MGIHAIGPGAVEYLLHGCDPAEPTPEPGVEQGIDLDGPQPGREPGRGRWVERDAGPGYFASGIAAGEPAGYWLGSGMAGLGLSMRSGDIAREEDVRALYGQLRYPDREYPGSTVEHPVSLGAKLRNYQTVPERVEVALKREPELTLTPERVREIEVTTARNTKSNTAYYDVTFSPVKSISIYYTALLAVGDVAGAERVKWCHDEAIRIAFESVERDVAWAKTGRHGSPGPDGRTTGEWEAATGLTVAVFAHHTNRDGEPQLHAHGAVLNRVALPDGRVYALDGAGFQQVKEALQVTYTRANEQLLTEHQGPAFVTRPDGKAREIAGIDPDLIAEGSTRTSAKVAPRVKELLDAYVDRHGHEPGAQARRQIADQAVKETRRPKSGPAGPAAVLAWAENAAGRRERLDASLDAVDRAGLEAALAGYGAAAADPEADIADPEADIAGPDAAMAGPEADTAEPGADMADPEADTAGAGRPETVSELVGRAVAAGVTDVQVKHATWTVSQLVEAIEGHLGDDAGALGVPAEQRRAHVWGLAAAAVAPGSGRGVVQVSAGDPVPIPDALRRAVDGRSRFRAPIDERYATTGHLATEDRLVAIARADGAARLGDEATGQVTAGLQAAGLSPDQVEAVAGIVSSGRTVDVLVGPAGAGKSHTIGALRQVWDTKLGGRVLGTATAQIATRNLSGLGLDAINTWQLVAAFTPNPATGVARDQLQRGDLVVLDEAGMTSTADLAAVVDLAAAAGAKVVLTGDHHQLDAVDAGGMFAHLAEKPGTLQLREVHRFMHPWEADASLKLRAGDPSAVPEYADHGRLRHGTLEAMEALAVEDYLADRLEGKTSLLVVGTNAHAAALSQTIRQRLVELGRVHPTPLAALPDKTRIAVGDVIQARENDRRLRVTPGVDRQGRVGPPWPVTNRETYTVTGRDPATGDLLAVDARGATAHLSPEYVREHVALAYAVTGNAAQSTTVDVGRGLLDRDATRESAYVPGSRGTGLNVFYLVTEQAPDEHDPRRLQETAAERLVTILGREGTEPAAVTVREAGQAAEASMSTLVELFDKVTTEQAHEQHAAVLAELLGPQRAEATEADPAYGRLLGAVRAAELDGHDAAVLLREAVKARSFAHARSVAEVMHHRVTTQAERRSPERRIDPADWTTFTSHRAGEVGDCTHQLALAINQRQAQLGDAAADAPPAWALHGIGDVPEQPPDQPHQRDRWVGRAGRVAGWREWRGTPAGPLSIGAPPPPAQQLARAVWGHTINALTPDQEAADLRRRSDCELYAVRERWARELDPANAPRSVADELGETHRLAHDAHRDAVIVQARLEQLAPGDPDRDRLAAAVASDRAFAEQYTAAAAGLEAEHTARGLWWRDTTPQREAAQNAGGELSRRGLPGWRGATPGPGDAPELDPTYPHPDLTPEPEVESEAAEVPDHVETDQPDPAPSLDAPETDQAPQPEGEPGGADLVEVDAPGEVVDPHAAFLRDLAARHEQPLAQVDPDQQLEPRAREAALRAADFAAFTAALRDQHGDRLDPDHQLDDVDLACAAELAGLHPALDAAPQAERAERPRGTHEPIPEPGPADVTPAGEPTAHVEPVLEQAPATEPEPTPAPEPQSEPAGDRQLELGPEPGPPSEPANGAPEPVVAVLEGAEEPAEVAGSRPVAAPVLDRQAVAPELATEPEPAREPVDEVEVPDAATSEPTTEPVPGGQVEPELVDDREPDRMLDPPEPTPEPETVPVGGAQVQPDSESVLDGQEPTPRLVEPSPELEPDLAVGPAGAATSEPAPEPERVEDREPAPVPEPAENQEPEPKNDGHEADEAEQARQAAAEQARQAAVDLARAAGTSNLERARREAAAGGRARQAEDAEHEAEFQRREQAEQIEREAAAREPEPEPQDEVEPDLEIGG